MSYSRTEPGPEKRSARRPLPRDAFGNYRPFTMRGSFVFEEVTEVQSLGFFEPAGERCASLRYLDKPVRFFARLMC